ncbi:MAG: CPBP family intramembrane glutamic endopeptidase [Candidatus Brocadiia bacterium]
MNRGSADSAPSASGPAPDLLPRDVPWGIFEGVALLVAFAGLQAVLGVLLSAREQGLGQLVVVGAISDGAILVIAVALVRAMREGPRPTVRRALGLVWPARRGLGTAVKAAVVGAVAYVGLTRAAAAVLEYFGSSWSELPRQQIGILISEAESGPVLLAAGVMAVVLAPVAEEVLFRGILYLPLRDRLGPVAAALVVGVVFSLCHFYPPGFFHLIVLSVVFTTAFEYTGSLWAAVVLHSLYNGLELVLLRTPQMLN